MIWNSEIKYYWIKSLELASLKALFSQNQTPPSFDESKDVFRKHGYPVGYWKTAFPDFMAPFSEPCKN